jgi:hypothetical protein
MSVLLSYDIRKTTDTIHSELKDRLVNHYGYSDDIVGVDGKSYQLPNTTLRKEQISSKDTSAEFIKACKEVGARWEKYIAAEFLVSSFYNQ